MTTPDKQTRRIHMRNVFEECGLALVDSSVKADKFQKGTNCSLYFYWPQGKGLNISINPNVDYLSLLKLEGVGIPKTLLKSSGLRPGTAVKDFPRAFEGFAPKDPQSRVGRMMEVQEFALQAFLKAFVLLVESPERNADTKNIETDANPAVHPTPADAHQLVTDSLSDTDFESSTQGYESDPVLRRVIEQYAVAWARNHYLSNGYCVTELGKPYDLFCERDGESLHVEVKGSRSMLSSVILTVNEVKDARDSSWRSDLFIVEGICIDVSNEAKPLASAGNARVLRNWNPKDADLSPNRFSYDLPDLSEWTPVTIQG